MIVNAIYEAFKAISDIVANFSLDKMLNGISSIKDSVGGFLDKINPLNLFSSDEKETGTKSQSKEQEPKKHNIEKIAPLEPLKIEPIKIEALKLEAQAPA